MWYHMFYMHKNKFHNLSRVPGMLNTYHPLVKYIKISGIQQSIFHYKDKYYLHKLNTL